MLGSAGPMLASSSLVPDEEGEDASLEETQAVAGLQPFQCLVCFKRFTRHVRVLTDNPLSSQENLKRHSAVHRSYGNAPSFRCELCTSTFARRDLKKRHMKKKHGTDLADSRADRLADRQTTEGSDRMPMVSEMDSATRAFESISSAGSHVSTSSNIPVEPFIAVSSMPPISAVTTQIGDGVPETELWNSDWQETTGSHRFDFSGTGTEFAGLASESMHISPATSMQSPGVGNELDFLSQSNIDEGVELYFEHVSARFPYLHRGTFDPQTCAPSLLLGMLSCSLQFSKTQPQGKRLGSQCYHRGTSILMADTQSQASTWALEPGIIQAHLLLQAHAILCACGPETRHGIHLLTRSVELARNGGLMEPLPVQPPATDLETLWRQFVRAESHKRTAYGTYQCDAMWYQTFSRPRLVSHLEIKHDLPCPDEQWQARTAEEWAHASLLKPFKPVRYIDAIRATLKPASTSELAAFGPSGLLCVLLFILTSVREVSGWATMSGRLCADRFEILHASLTALEPIIRRHRLDPVSVGLEATWQMTVLELLLWSAPHTGGLIEISLDAALAAATSMTASKPIVLAPQVAEALDPHLSWFLNYIAGPTHPNDEAPWVTMYAYKACLVAWQLARDGAFDLNQRIGVADLPGMQAWMSRVFGRREVWGVGRLIVNSLKELNSAVL